MAFKLEGENAYNNNLQPKNSHGCGVGTLLPFNMKNVLADDLIRDTLQWYGKFTLKVKKSEGCIKVFPSKKMETFFL